MVLEALNGIDLAVAEAEDAHIRAGKKEPLPPPSNNHIFVNAVAPDPEVGPQDVADHIRELMDRFQVIRGLCCWSTPFCGRRCCFVLCCRWCCGDGPCGCSKSSCSINGGVSLSLYWVLLVSGFVC